MASGTFTPYSTVESLFGAKPTWIPDPLDVMRIQSYQTYEQIYWNVPDIFRVSLRGANELPIYVPSGRTIVDTTNRYTAPKFGVSITSRTGGTSADATAATLALGEFFKREKFKPKFNGNKRYGLIRGDALWHITADPEKAEGSRISLTAIDPGMYFPIYDDEDVSVILGVHLVEQVTTADGPRIRRLTYRKVPQASGVNQITVEDGLFEVDKWGGPGFSPALIIQPPTPLPPEITQIPVYHWPNFDEPGNPFGSSELRGLERVMGGLNQTMSDEDLALALEGIGVYATDSSEPTEIINGRRVTVPWRMGPGRVVHYDGEKFDRIAGVSNLGSSYGAHYDRLRQALFEASATPEVAVGRVDVSIAQSGIALALQLGPMLAKSGEKNDSIIGTHEQMFYDLVTMWYAAYEESSWEDISVTCVAGDAVPVDREKRFEELNDMYDRGIIDAEFYRSECRKLGYVFPEGIGTRAAAEYKERNVDQFAERVNEEAGDDESAA